MLKRITGFVGGCILAYGGIRFLILVHTLLAAGQFFTPILAMGFAGCCIVVGGILILLAVED
jgi:hypothetical protein